MNMKIDKINNLNKLPWNLFDCPSAIFCFGPGLLDRRGGVPRPRPRPRGDSDLNHTILNVYHQ